MRQEINSSLAVIKNKEMQDCQIEKLINKSK